MTSSLVGSEMCIRDSFRDAPRALTHGKEVDGRTLFQRVVKDKAEAKVLLGLVVVGLLLLGSGAVLGVVVL
eukprot:5873132-Prorocentrum_lima.AAC.1